MPEPAGDCGVLGCGAPGCATLRWAHGKRYRVCVAHLAEARDDLSRRTAEQRVGLWIEFDVKTRCCLCGNLAPPGGHQYGCSPDAALG